MKIPLTQGKVAIINKIDADLAQLNWWTKKGGRTFYAQRGARTASGRWTTQTLHRIIAQRMGIHGRVDHKDQNGLNCRRNNLRSATAHENSSNRRRQLNNTSGFIGVTWHKPSQQWRAQISHYDKMKGIGYYPGTDAGRIEAARAYNKRAIELRGNWAILNPV